MFYTTEPHMGVPIEINLRFVTYIGPKRYGPKEVAEKDKKTCLVARMSCGSEVVLTKNDFNKIRAMIDDARAMGTWTRPHICDANTLREVIDAQLVAVGVPDAMRATWKAMWERRTSVAYGDMNIGQLTFMWFELIGPNEMVRHLVEVSVLQEATARAQLKAAVDGVKRVKFQGGGRHAHQG